MTAEDLLRFGIVDRIVEEPTGGAHQDHDAAAAAVGAAISDALENLDRMDPAELVDDRYRRFRALGVFTSTSDNAENVRSSD